MRSMASVSILACVGLFTLAACEPSEKDIYSAIESKIEKESAPTANLLGDEASGYLVPKLNSVRKIGCVKAEKSTGYKCDFEIEASNGLTGNHKEVVNARFVKGEDGWEIVE